MLPRQIEVLIRLLTYNRGLLDLAAVGRQQSEVQMEALPAWAS